MMCGDAGIIEKKTNHSLRATGASALFNAGVQEEMIREVNGHRSNALLLYERPSNEQRKMVSQVLIQGGSKENVPANSPTVPAVSPPTVHMPQSIPPVSVLAVHMPPSASYPACVPAQAPLYSLGTFINFSPPINGHVMTDVMNLSLYTVWQ